MFIKVLTAAALTVGLVVVAPGAQAQDRRACVSKVEYDSLQGFVYAKAEPGHSVTEAEVEAHWEVRANPLYFSSDPGGPWTLYRRCGYRNVFEAYYAVSYNGHGEAVGSDSWKSPTATLHGHP